MIKIDTEKSRILKQNTSVALYEDGTITYGGRILKYLDSVLDARYYNLDENDLEFKKHFTKPFDQIINTQKTKFYRFGDFFISRDSNGYNYYELNLKNNNAELNWFYCRFVLEVFSFLDANKNLNVSVMTDKTIVEIKSLDEWCQNDFFKDTNLFSITIKLI